MLFITIDFICKLKKIFLTFGIYINIVINLSKDYSKMKKTLLILAIFGFLMANAQSVFDEYGGNPSVSNLTVSPQMFKLMSKFKISTDDPESQALIDMIQGLKRFRVMSTKDADIAHEMEVWMQSELQDSALESILNMTEKGVNVQFGAVYGEGGDTVDRLVMYVKGLQGYLDTQEDIQVETTTDLDFILLEIVGAIDLEQVGALTQLIDVPGGEYLDALKN